jgi:hypothetical protein
MSEIPVYPDECEHGNAHIEGVNECAVCQCDATTRALEASRLEINRIQLERDEARATLAAVRSRLEQWDWSGLLRDAKAGEHESAVDALRCVAAAWRALNGETP